MINDARSWRVRSSEILTSDDRPSDLVKVLLSRPRNGRDGGIPLARGEVAMLFLEGYTPGDHPNLLDIRSQGYGEDGLAAFDHADVNSVEVGRFS